MFLFDEHFCVGYSFVENKIENSVSDRRTSNNSCDRKSDSVQQYTLRCPGHRLPKLTHPSLDENATIMQDK